jgi:hypothetical protein
MAREEMTVIQLCGVCRTEVGSFTVKQENMMLTSKAKVWCPKCNAYTPEVRDLPGRRASIDKEVESLPEAGSP